MKEFKEFFIEEPFFALHLFSIIPCFIIMFLAIPCEAAHIEGSWQNIVSLMNIFYFALWGPLAILLGEISNKKMLKSAK